MPGVLQIRKPDSLFEFSPFTPEAGSDRISRLESMLVRIRMAAIPPAEGPLILGLGILADESASVSGDGKIQHAKQGRNCLRMVE